MIMSLEEEVLTLVAATEDQADFITGEGTAGGQELLQEEEV